MANDINKQDINQIYTDGKQESERTHPCYACWPLEEGCGGQADSCKGTGERMERGPREASNPL